MQYKTTPIGHSCKEDFIFSKHVSTWAWVPQVPHGLISSKAVSLHTVCIMMILAEEYHFCCWVMSDYIQVTMPGLAAAM